MNVLTLFQALSRAIPISLIQGVVIVTAIKIIELFLPKLSAEAKFRLNYTGLAFLFGSFFVTLTATFFITRTQLNIPATSNVIPVNVKSLNTETLPYTFWVGTAYVTAVIGQLLCYTAGLLAVARLKRSKGLIELDEWTEKLAVLKHQLTLSKSVKLYFSHITASPFTIGYLKPIILFPIAAVNNLNQEQVEAILLHELAHIKRNDYLLNLFQRVFEIVLFFNPATWILSKAIKSEREFCCDDLVVERTNPLSYVQALLALEENTKRRLAFAMPASPTKKYSLFTRIKRLTVMKTPGTSPKHRTIAVLAILSIGLSLAFAFPKTEKEQPAKEKPEFAKAGDIKAKPKKEISAPALSDTSKKKLRTTSASKTLTITVDSLKGDTTETARIEKEMEKVGKEMEKVGKEMEAFYSGKEWTDHIKEIEKMGKEIDKKFNSAEWKAYEKAIEKHGAQMEKHFSGKEFQDLQNLLEKAAKEFEQDPQNKEKKLQSDKLNSLQTELSKKFENGNKNTQANLDQLKKDFEKKFGNDSRTFNTEKFNKLGEDLKKQFESKEWNQKMAALSSKMAELSKELALKFKDFKVEVTPELPELPEKPEAPEREEKREPEIN